VSSRSPFDAVTLIAAVLIYLVLNFPLADADAAQQAGYTRWYAGVYYVVLALVSLLGGALISVVLMLYNAVRDVIQVLGPDRDESSFVRSEEAAQEAKRQAIRRKKRRKRRGIRRRRPVSAPVRRRAFAGGTPSARAAPPPAWSARRPPRRRCVAGSSGARPAGCASAAHR
jgi:hypothetical protein